MPMKMNDILEVIKDLAKSQGFYGRTYEELMRVKQYEPETWDSLVNEWESKNFETALDFIMWFEIGDEDKEEEDYSDIEEILDREVKSYSTSDYNDTVYIYNDIAYIGEEGYDFMISQIVKDYDL